MLPNHFGRQGDYESSLRRRRACALAMLGVGILGIACSLLLVPHSGLSSHAQGFYAGAAWGLFCAAGVLLARTQYLLQNAAARKRAKIEETDERMQHITGEAAQFAGVFTVFSAFAALFVVLPLSLHAYLALLCILLVYGLAFGAAMLWLSKRT